MSEPFKDKFIINPVYLPVPSKRRSGLKISKVRFLVAHDTGNPGSTASQNVTFYTRSANEISASAHLFVDDREIIECIPALTGIPEKAWHVLYNVPKDNEMFGVNANDAAIGVEYCYGGTIDADKAYQKYVWVLAKLCDEFGLDPSKDIVGHFFLDPKRKTDPVTGLANSRRTYEQLLRDVLQEFLACGGTLPSTPELPALEKKVNFTATVRVNLRKEPNMRAEIVQVIPSGAVLTIADTIKDGQPINNNPVWLKDLNGNFAWSGAFQ